MLYKHEYHTEIERQNVMDENVHLFFIEEQNITEGNFLIFSDEPIPEKTVYKNVPQEEFEELKQENTILKAQNNALSERADFIEDVVAEIAIQVYQ